MSTWAGTSRRAAGWWSTSRFIAPTPSTTRTLGRPVIDEYPLFQLALYFSTLGGLVGALSCFCALGYVLLLAILVLTARALGLRASSTFAVVMGLMLLYLQLAFPLRPHLVTYLGIAAFGSFLLRHREAGNWMRFWPLALVQVVWTNCHSGFVLGPAMVALFGLEMILRRWHRSRLFPWTAVRTWAGRSVLVFLGCFVNPVRLLRFEPPFLPGASRGDPGLRRRDAAAQRAEPTLLSAFTLLAAC